MLMTAIHSQERSTGRADVGYSVRNVCIIHPAAQPQNACRDNLKGGLSSILIQFHGSRVADSRPKSRSPPQLWRHYTFQVTPQILSVTVCSPHPPSCVYGHICYTVDIQVLYDDCISKHDHIMPSIPPHLRSAKLADYAPTRAMA